MLYRIFFEVDSLRLVDQLIEDDVGGCLFSSFKQVLIYFFWFERVLVVIEITFCPIPLTTKIFGVCWVAASSLGLAVLFGK